MSSISSNPVRVAPQQQRSMRRLAGFLEAAAELFVEVGYEAATMTAVAEAELFIERITQFVQERPAYLSLLAAPIRFRRDPAARKASRIAIANAFQAKNPSLSKEQSLLAADVSLQIVRGMMTLYGEADSKGKVLVVAEFKKVLTLYLGCVLSEDPVLAK
jgi:hypothetical protein